MKQTNKTDEKEFCLSEEVILDKEVPRYYYLAKDVKEFIKTLKQRIWKSQLSIESSEFLNKIINRLAGDKLI